MSKRFLTVMVIPHNEDRVRELQISRGVLWGLIGVLGLSVLGLFYYAVGYYVGLEKEAHYADLKGENSALQDQFEALQGRLGGLRRQIDQLTDTDRKMRAWASFSEPGDDVRRMGVGGAAGSPAPWENRTSERVSRLLTDTHYGVDQLIREARFLKASFDSIAGHFSRNDTVRRHTPSILPMPTDAGWWYSSGFGRRRDPFTGRPQAHYAIDIAGRKGTPILASADGKVDKVSFHARLGHHIKLDHGSGVFTLYGHLQSAPKLKKGSRVTRGQMIGRMGESGRTTAPHLHYAVHVNDRAMNPKLYIFNTRGAAAVF